MQVRSHTHRSSRGTLATVLLAVATAGCQTLAQTAGRPVGAGEMVNVGYGTADRSRITSSVASIDSMALERQPVASIEEMLRGLPGVVVIGRGPGAQVRIRGATSFLGSSDPLYVIDGVAVPFGMAQPLAGINPHDVARIDVLKDATAAIYGVRGANGVVLITTKRAR